MSLEKEISFGFEQTLTIPTWWTSPGFCATSDTDDKFELMRKLTQEIINIQGGRSIENQDIWDNRQFELRDKEDNPSFFVTLDPGSIEVKTPPRFLNEIVPMAQVLMDAAEKAGLVAYRTWWYGVQGGTEGGCHVNMGGINKDSNPFIKDPYLLIQYAAFMHNRPWLTFGFQGADIGPLGNAMRLDEKPDWEMTQKLFREFPYQKGQVSLEEVLSYFKDSSLIKEKSSAPSLAKFKDPYYLVEDRAQEALRDAHDFLLVAKLRLEILKHLQAQNSIEDLKEFPTLHDEMLTSQALWQGFLTTANELNLDAAPYKVFFDRQFPLLPMGQNIPKHIQIFEGRRTRTYLGEKKNKQGVVISRTVDTRYKRFELRCSKKNSTLEVKGKGIEFISPNLSTNPEEQFFYLNIKSNPDNPVLSLTIKKDNQLIESAKFNVNDMMWN